MFSTYHAKTNQSVADRIKHLIASETMDLSLLPDLVKPKTIRIGIHCYTLLNFSIKKGCETSTTCAQ